MYANLDGVADGAYLVHAEVMDGGNLGRGGRLSVGGRQGHHARSCRHRHRLSQIQGTTA